MLQLQARDKLRYSPNRSSSRYKLNFEYINVCLSFISIKVKFILLVNDILRV